MSEVIIVETSQQAGQLYAQAAADLIATKPSAVLGLATGSTPLVAYRALADLIHERNLDVSQVSGFALDEYVNLPPDHPESYRSVITRTVVEPLGLDPTRVQVPNSFLETIAKAGEEYDAAIQAAGGIDLQILGIGTDGHIGFNEPGSSLASGTRIKTLTEQTRLDNARFFGSLEQVPTHCITQGVGTILRARHLVLLAFGEHKAAALAACVEGSVSAFCPASALQLHPHATVIIDEAAASCLKHAEYYRWAYVNKPSWQGI